MFVSTVPTAPWTLLISSLNLCSNFFCVKVQQIDPRCETSEWNVDTADFLIQPSVYIAIVD
jgi:hypothetical protein